MTHILPPPIRPPKRNSQLLGQAGFSLIELIMVMILMGIAGSMASFGLVTFVKYFTTTKDTNYTAGKSQMAMLRIMKEMTAVEMVTAASASSITFKSRHGPNAADLKTYTLSLSGSNLILNGGSDDILTDQVTAFTLSYAPDLATTPTSTWTGCTNPFTIAKDWYEWRSYASAYRFDIQFDDTNASHLSDYRVSYGNATYGTAGWASGKDYTVVNASSSTKTFATSPVYYFPKAYIWSVARGRNCYVAIDVVDANNAGLTPGGDGPPAILSRLINVSLTMQGPNNTPVTFTTRAFPRNI